MSLLVKRSPIDISEIPLHTDARPSESAFWRFVEASFPPEGIPLVAIYKDTMYPEKDFDKIFISEMNDVTLCVWAEDDEIMQGLGMLAVAAIAIMTVQPWVAGMSIFGEAGALAGMGKAAGFLAASATMMAGGMVVNSLASRPSPNVAALDGSTELASSPTYSWNPVTTQKQGSVVPRGYGTDVLYGNIIDGYRTYDGDKVYLNVLICLGIGPYSRLYDFKLNDQTLDQAHFPGVDIHVRGGYINQTCIPFFAETSIETVVGTRLRHDEDPVVVDAIGSDFNGLDIDIGFPDGLGYMNDQNKLVDHSVQVKVEISSDGGATWRTLSKSATPTTTSVPVNRWSGGAWAHGEDYEQVYWQELEVGTTTYSDHYEGEPYYALDGSMVGSWQWITSSAIKTVDVLNDYSIYSGATRGARTYTISVRGLVPGNHKIRVTKVSADNDDFRYIETTNFVAYKKVLAGDEFQYPRHVLVGIRGLATDRLSGSFNFSCKADQAIVMTSTDLVTWTPEFTHNPAWHVLDILSRPVFANDFTVIRYDGVNPTSDNINLAKLLEVAQFCDYAVPDGDGGSEARATFDAQFDFKTNVWAAIMRILDIARTVPLYSGKQVTFAIDQAETVRNIYTVGNIEVDSYRSDWPSTEDRAQMIIASFKNEEKNYEMDSFLDIRPTIDSDKETTLDCFGITKPSRVWRHTGNKLAHNEYEKVTSKISVFLAHLRDRKGDVIGVQHDVPQIGKGGRLVSATINTVTLDQTVTLAPLTSYAIIVIFTYPSVVSHAGTNYRCKITNTATAATEPGVGADWADYWEVCTDTADEAWTSGHEYIQAGEPVERNISTAAGDHTTLTLATNLPRIPNVAPDGGRTYDQYTLGPVANLYKPYRIVDIQPAQNFKATLELSEYNASMYDIDAGSPVLPTPLYNTWDLFPDATNITAIEFGNKEEGRRTSDVALYWKRPQNEMYASAEIWYKSDTGGNWIKAGQTDGTEMLVANLVPGAYTFIVRTINSSGLKQPIENAPSYSMTVVGLSGTGTFEKPKGLRLEGTANPHDTVWKGLKFTVVWREASNVGGLDAAGLDTETYGADTLSSNPYWAGDEVEVWIGGTRVHSVNVGKALRFDYIYGDGIDAFLDALLVAANGTVTIKTRRLSTVNQPSAWNSITLTHGVPDAPTGFTVDFTGRDCVFAWDKSTDPALDHYLLTLNTTAKKVQRAGFTYTFDENRKDNTTPDPSLSYNLKVVDVFGNQSAAEAGTVTNTAPATPTGVNLGPTFNSVICKFNKGSEPDIAGYQVYASTSMGFTPGPENLLYDGPQTQVAKSASANTAYYFRVRAYDAFGQYSAYTDEETASTIFIAPSELYTSLRTDFLVKDSIFSFTGTTLSWTAGSIVRGDTVYTLSPGSLANANAQYVIATLSAGAATLSKAALVALPVLTADQVIIAYTSTGTTTDGNYICYVREANSLMVEGADIRDATIRDAKIYSLSVAKLLAGTITSQIFTLAMTEGLGDVAIRCGKTDFGDTTEGFIFGMDDSASNKVKIEIGNATNYMSYYNGTLTVAGTIVVTSGSSGYTNFSDKPSSLGGINAGEGTKLAGIQAGATVGADWNSNLANIPSRFVGPGAAGLYMTSSYVGYYNGATWPAYIANDGTFYFAGNGTNYIYWNGAALTIRGSLNASDITTGTLTAVDILLNGNDRSLWFVNPDHDHDFRLHNDSNTLYIHSYWVSDHTTPYSEVYEFHRTYFRLASVNLEIWGHDTQLWFRNESHTWWFNIHNDADNLYISPYNGSSYSSQYLSVGNDGLYLWGTNTGLYFMAATGYAYRWHSSGDYLFLRIYSGGSPTGNYYIFEGSNGYLWTMDGLVHTISDIRFKTDVSPITGALEIVKKFRGINFDGDGEHVPRRGYTRWGFSAQDVLQEFPHMVDNLPGQEGYYGLAYGQFDPLFVEAFKEMEAKIAALQAEVDALKAA